MAFLSNFALVPIAWEGILYPSVEHAFQAAKTLDVATRQRIAQAPTPGAAKSLGRHVPLRPEWNRLRVSVMRELLAIKFAQPAFAIPLRTTAPRLLVEGNSWNDTFWGVCRGQGQNWLGQLLMERRDLLR